MPKGFFAALFDMSFDSLITTRIVKLVYVLALVLNGLTALLFVVAGFQSGSGAGILVLLVGAPLLSAVYLVFVRVFLEAVIALFRIMENTQALVELTSPPTDPGSAPAP